MTSDAAKAQPSQFQQLITAGLEHHRAGRLQQAEAAYRQVLQQQPDQPDALGLLGVVALQAGQPKVAVELLSRCVQLAGGSASFASYNNLGEALRQVGRINDAIAAFKRAIELKPDHPDAYSNLALATAGIGQIDETVRALERAVQLSPIRFDWHDRLGSAYLQQGDTFGAIRAFRQAIALRPDFAMATSNLGVSLTRKPSPTKSELDEAVTLCRRGLELAPNVAAAHGSLAIVLDRAGQINEAVREFERAATLDPPNADFYGLRATILQKVDRVDEAIAVFEEGARRCPNDARMYSNLSGLRRRKRDYPGAVRDAERAVELAPNYSDGHGNLALSLLAAGDYERGFVEYEWRWRCDNFTTAPREFARPMWNGSSDLTGRTILVHTEQGFGDTIQFVRYVSLLADAGARVILECHHSLTKLLSRVRGVERVIAAGLALPDFDLHTPMLSLPRAFKTTLDHLPAEMPYVTAAPERIEEWKRRTAGDGLRVGLIWAGNANPDPKRNVPGQMLRALAGVDGMRWFSLQRRDAGTYTPPPDELKLIDLSADLTDFHETAAAMSAMDLIITIDTSTAHLAGALGRPTWTLVPWSPDWRWLLDRDDSPWYPTMRLFRQTKVDEWGDALERVRTQLDQGGLA